MSSVYGDKSFIFPDPFNVFRALRLLSLSLSLSLWSLQSADCVQPRPTNRNDEKLKRGLLTVSLR